MFLDLLVISLFIRTMCIKNDIPNISFLIYGFFSGNIFSSAPSPAKKSLAIETRPLRAG